MAAEKKEINQHDEQEPIPADAEHSEDKPGREIVVSFVKGAAFALGRKVVDNTDKIWDFFTK
ncbi:hypothetical protein Caci_8925 [Catenulispora acidiphila DSM 44928]|uniref:Uncharacterized protein n=1 Tax=Catenulispora acidiphila (strain DSM 44928 / JCM 14897 / NBRC 102108 / NRRL B-24433 / ID139908) TaxID=479433 RepID=C7Q3Y0_CATAD|nr:hypothetical protein [Catenulispora acidiphila]ACU77738.1 hypothetical protein Caci_8925 [Catenulispora acidiphila DSM 44928]